MTPFIVCARLGKEEIRGRLRFNRLKTTANLNDRCNFLSHLTVKHVYSNRWKAEKDITKSFTGS